MKVYISLFLGVLFFSFFSCHDKPNTPIRYPEDKLAKDSFVKPKYVKNTKNKQNLPKPVVNAPQKDSVELKFVGDSAFLEVNHQANKNNVFYFNNVTRKKLFIKINSNDSLANIRINQIISPNKNADGPWHNYLEYNLTQKGKYLIILGENMMAGDAWNGQFSVKFRVK